MRPWAQRTVKTALLGAGFAAAAGGLSGVALAAGSNVSSDASPGLSLGQLVAPAGVCDDTGALLGVVGAACQVGTAVLPPAAPAQTGRGTTSSSPAGSKAGRPPACGSAAAVLGDSPAGCVRGALAGLGALPGLADLPSLAGLANTPAQNGVSGGGIPMPGTALSAANTSGMSSDSFAALAVGALLAGASALKIAGRRARDRKAGFGVAI